MTDPRMKSIRAVLKECFWGDYNLTAQEILDRLEKNVPGFNRFLFSKIIENGRYPSRHIKNIFPPAAFKTLLKAYRQHAGEKKRLRLIAANLIGDYSQAPEYQWHR